jgi:hypothetical protein
MKLRHWVDSSPSGMNALKIYNLSHCQSQTVSTDDRPEEENAEEKSFM